MKKLVMGLVLATTLFTSNVSANEIEKQIPISNIEAMQGEVTELNSLGYTIIDTLDGYGAAIEFDNNFSIGDTVVVIFNNMGTKTIYDDEIISIYKIQK